MHQISVLYGDGTLLAPFTPGRLGSNMYTLESLPLKGVSMTCTLTYDIVHCRLGHPSKDVICHAHKRMWNFPDVEIPNMDCYWYIIIFVDDYTSMAWTTPLCTKDAALVATHHFLKMVSTQFKT